MERFDNEKRKDFTVSDTAGTDATEADTADATAGRQAGPGVRADGSGGEGRGVRLEDLPDVMTAADVAEVLQCSDKHVYDLGVKGVIPRIKVGRLVRFPKRGFLKWLNSGGEDAA